MLPQNFREFDYEKRKLQALSYLKEAVITVNHKSECSKPRLKEYIGYTVIERISLRKESNQSLLYVQGNTAQIL